MKTMNINGLSVYPNEMKALHCEPKQYRVKLFGGSMTYIMEQVTTDERRALDMFNEACHAIGEKVKGKEIHRVSLVKGNHEILLESYERYAHMKSICLPPGYACEVCNIPESAVPVIHGRNLDEMHKELITHFKGLFVYKGGRHIAVHVQSYQPNLQPHEYRCVFFVAERKRTKK